MSKRSFTINLDEEIITKIKKLSKANDMKTSELVSRVLMNFISSFDVLKDPKQSKATKESDEDKYVEYYESLRKVLTSDDIPPKSKNYLVG